MSPAATPDTRSRQGPFTNAVRTPLGKANVGKSMISHIRVG